MRKRSKILSDHKKRGKKLVTPFNEAIGPIFEVSWVKIGIPEFLGFALIQLAYGHSAGVQLITTLMRSARKIRFPSSGVLWGASALAELTTQEGDTLQNELSGLDILTDLQECLASLVSWYPSCPFGVLFTTPPPRTTSLGEIKRVVSLLYERNERDPMLVQATGVWLMFDSGKLKVAKGLTLERFPEIERYPDTEISRRLGGLVRAALNNFMGFHESSGAPPPWPNHFWNRGLEIDECEFNNA